MRAFLLSVLLLASAGCGNGAPTTTADQAAQFVVSVRACVPTWFLTPPTLEIDSLGAITLLVAAGDLSSRTLAPFECVLRAGSDCVQVRACYGLRSDATSGPCMGAPPRCDGDDLLVCIPAVDPAPTQIGRIDCTQQGLSCLEAESGGVMLARCSTALCDGMPAPRCDGDTAIACDGVFETSERAPLGTACSDALGFVRFVGVGEPCTASECVDGVLNECDLETQRTRAVRDCNVIGQSCSEASFAHCFQEDVQCGASTIPSCVSATLLRFCAPDGRIRDYDCAANGFAGCEVSFVPERGLSFGGCTPRGPRF